MLHFNNQCKFLTQTNRRSCQKLNNIPIIYAIVDAFGKLSLLLCILSYLYISQTYQFLKVHTVGTGTKHCNQTFILVKFPKYNGQQYDRISKVILSNALQITLNQILSFRYNLYIIKSVANCVTIKLKNTKTLSFQLLGLEDFKDCMNFNKPITQNIKIFPLTFFTNDFSVCGWDCK